LSEKGLFERAYDLARYVDDEVATAHAATNLAELRLAMGRSNEARDALDVALTAHEAVRLYDGLSYGLEAAARLAWNDGRSEDAARLLGAADGLREEVGVPIWGPRLSRFETLVGSVRNAVGDDAFAATWAEGAHSASTQRSQRPARSCTEPRPEHASNVAESSRDEGLAVDLALGPPKPSEIVSSAPPRAHDRSLQEYCVRSRLSSRASSWRRSSVWRSDSSRSARSSTSWRSVSSRSSLRSSRSSAMPHSSAANASATECAWSSPEACVNEQLRRRR